MIDPRNITPEEFTASKEAEKAYFDSKTSLKAQITNHIFSKYPAAKQASDTADKMYFETVLKADGFPKLEITIQTILRDIALSSKTLAESLEEFPEETHLPLSRLVKVANRVVWVQHCKAAYFKAKQDNASTITFPPGPKTI